MTDTTPWHLKNYKQSITSRGRLLPQIEQQLIKDSVERNAHRDTKHLHPSEISKRQWCPRSSWYQITAAPKAAESFSFQRLNVFEEGHNIHDKYQKWLWKLGILVGRFQCEACGNSWFDQSPHDCPECGEGRLRYREVPIRDDEHRIIGHADGEINDSAGRALIEIKSVGIGTVRFEKPALYDDYAAGKLTIDDVWKNIKTPFASHVRQGHLYMHARKLDTIIFIYEWKPSQQVKEFEIKFNPEILAPMLEGCKLVMEHLDSNTPPDRPSWATGPGCQGCRFCPFKKVCFP